MRRTLTSLLASFVTAGVVACSSYGNPMTSPRSSPSAATISATPSLAFSPSAVTVAPGGTVTFAFGSVGHSVKFDAAANAPTDITGVNANTSITRTFATAGTYTFHCTIHPAMTGTVTVAATTSGGVSPGNGGGY